MGVFLLVWELVFLFLGGCVSTRRPPTPAETFSSSARVEHPAVGSLQPDSSAVMSTPSSQDPADLERLAQLWQTRIYAGSFSDYPIGPGDVLQISVPAMDELNNYAARVSGEGTITLPLIGVVPVARLTEQQTREEIRSRLTERYMYDPQVNLFVREYRSRQVAVIGAVNKPGLYNLAGEADTILDMISQAGGMTDTAASRILFIPAEPGEERQAKELAAVLPVALGNRDSSLTLKRPDPIVIDLQYLHRGGQQISLTLPARPGDVIIVPTSGEVLVEGWVKNPASYKISQGMTVLGAVAAAGDLLFAADTSAVKVLRTGRGGEKIFLSADLEKIKSGESSDIPVEAGDVVEVSSSSLRIVPYGVYSFFSNIVRLGASAPLY